MIPHGLIVKLFKEFIKLIPKNYSEEMFYRIGRFLGVRSFTCDKELGLFEGSINDNTVHRYYFKYGTWAPGLQYILNKLITNSPGTYIDVGANIGLTLIQLAKSNKLIDIYAFEPEYNNYNFLLKNIINNKLESKVKTYNIALYSEDCTLDLELSEDNMGDHRVRPQSASDLHGNNQNEKSGPIVQINARKLDSVLNVEDLVKPIVIKIDTQGAEVRVLAGATNLLKEVDYLIVEYWPYGLKRMGDTTEAFSNIIEQFPFGSTYDDNCPLTPKLLPATELLPFIDSCLDKNGINHLDILLSKHPTLHVQTTD